ncbi:MAG: hypothetical protein ABEN55_12280, partial [Bradymonadaceae bacterium]
MSSTEGTETSATAGMPSHQPDGKDAVAPSRRRSIAPAGMPSHRRDGEGAVARNWCNAISGVATVRRRPWRRGGDDTA